MSRDALTQPMRLHDNTPEQRQKARVAVRRAAQRLAADDVDVNEVLDALGLLEDE